MPNGVKDKVIDLLSGALHMAASGGHTEIIKYLQSKGCDVSVKDKVIDLLSEALHLPYEVPQTIDLLPCL
jgi:hypothetical protein